MADGNKKDGGTRVDAPKGKSQVGRIVVSSPEIPPFLMKGAPVPANTDGLAGSSLFAAMAASAVPVNSTFKTLENDPSVRELAAFSVPAEAVQNEAILAQAAAQAPAVVTHSAIAGPADLQHSMESLSPKTPSVPELENSGSSADDIRVSQAIRDAIYGRTINTPVDPDALPVADTEHTPTKEQLAAMMRRGSAAPSDSLANKMDEVFGRDAIANMMKDVDATVQNTDAAAVSSQKPKKRKSGDVSKTISLSQKEAPLGGSISGDGTGATIKTIFGPDKEHLLQYTHDGLGHLLQSPKPEEIAKAKQIFDAHALKSEVGPYVRSEHQPVPGREYFEPNGEAPHGGYFFFPNENRVVKIIVDSEDKADSETVYEANGVQIGKTKVFDKPRTAQARHVVDLKAEPVTSEDKDANNTVILSERPGVDRLKSLFKPIQNKTAALIGSLSKNERDSVGGQERRRKVAHVLGIAGGIAGSAGTVMAVKMTATTVALWLGAPALAVTAASILGVMAATGTIAYVTQRMAAKRNSAYAPGPTFMSFLKPAAMAGGMALTAFAVPAMAMLAVGTAVAGLGAGVYEYNSKRKESGARFSLLGFGKSMLFSKAMHRAVLVSGAVGATLTALTALGVYGYNHFSSPADGLVPTPTPIPVPAPVAPDVAASAPAPVVDPSIATAPAVGVPAVLASDAPSVEAASPVSVAAAPSVASPSVDTSGNNYQLPADYTGVKAPDLGAPVSEPIVQADGSVVTKYAGDVTKVEHVSRVLEISRPEATVPVEQPLVSSVADTAKALPDQGSVVTPVSDFKAVAPLPPAAGNCSIPADGVNIKCVMDPNVTLKPNDGIDFNIAARPEAGSLRVDLAPTSAPQNGIEFLKNVAVPEALKAFRNGNGLAFLLK